MRFSKVFLIILFCSFTHLYPVTYKLKHQNQTPWPGFFSIFNTVLGALDYYENFQGSGFILDFENKGFFYDPDLGNNWWQYYFEPLNFTDKEAEPIEEFKTYKMIIFGFYAQLKMSRERSHELIQKYIKVKPHIQKKVLAFVQENFDGEFVIGIHYRGTDKNLEAPLMAYNSVILALRQELQIHPNAKIFVATDDSNFLFTMYQQFPGKIIATNALRSNNGQPVHSDTNKDPYQKGEDALIDCLLLAHCSKLYKTASNLSDVAIKFNPTLPVISLTKHYTESTQFANYNFFKAFNAILLLLTKYERNPQNGFTAYFPTINTTNWWETLFEPLQVGDPHPQTQLSDVDVTILGFTGIYDLESHTAHEVIKKYIRIKPHILEKIDELYAKKLADSYVISIFFMKEEQDKYQRYNEVMLRTHQALKKAPSKSKILLITNDETFLSLMNKEFTNIVNPILTSWTLLPGETDLLFTLMMARSNLVIGTSSIYLTTVGHFNPELPLIKIGTFWLEE